MDIEFKRNKERFAFLRWGSTAFRNMLVVPPGSGIVHQVSSWFWYWPPVKMSFLIFPFAYNFLFALRFS